LKRILVQFYVWQPEEIPAICQSVGAVDDGWRIPMVRTFRIDIADEASEAAVVTLRSNPLVKKAVIDDEFWAENHGYYASSNDPLILSQWHLIRHSVFRAWKYTKGDPAIKVGWVDEGTWPHEDVPWPQGWNAASHTNDPRCLYPYWNPYADPVTYTVHGLVTMGLVVAQGDNDTGVSGVAPNITPYMTTPVDSGGSWQDYLGSLSRILECLQKQLDFGCRVSSNSWDGSVPTDEAFIIIAEAYEALWDAGCVIVVSAGNQSNPMEVISEIFGLMVPQDISIHPELTTPVPIIICASIEPDDSGGQFRYWSSYDHTSLPVNEPSNYGQRIDITAAGYQIFTADIPFIGEPPVTSTNYACLPDENAVPPWPRAPIDVENTEPHCGTSFATPLVSGVCALILSVNPSLTPQQVRDIVLGATDAGRFQGYAYPGGQWYGSPYPNGIPAYSTIYPNAGVLNAAKAVQKALTTVSGNAGLRYPYFNAWGDGASHSVTDGVLTTTLNGSVSIEVGGYSSDAITGVELWIGANKIYDGPPSVFTATATSTGSPQALKIVAKTAGGSTEESFSDFVVDLLELGPPDLFGSLDLSFTTDFTFDAIFEPAPEPQTPVNLPRNLTLGRGYLYGAPESGPSVLPIRRSRRMVLVGSDPSSKALVGAKQPSKMVLVGGA